MNGIVPGFRGAFTPSQWMELEQQALIYKYLAAKMPVPSSLVIPIRRNLNPSGFPSFASGFYRTGALGCSSFNLAFARNADPESGRCRRTDGKKWRCSRDAVGDQKYCERHMNRGRHRSRKHVEGHNGHAAKAAMPTPSQSASAVSSCSSNNINSAHQQQIKSLQSCMEESSPTQFDRFLMNKGTESERAQNSQSTSIPTNLCSVFTDTLFPIFKQQTSFEGTIVCADFGLTLPDSPSNPPRSSDPEKLTCMLAPKMQDQQSKSHPLLHFIDDWPKSHSVNEMHTDRMQLSISIPMGSSHYSSSSSSPKKYKLASSSNPLKEGNNRHYSWIPVSWDPMIGGPLGEVLKNKSMITENNSMNNSSSPLNLLSNGWNSSPRLDSLPTGVLQKTCFVSLPSSTGSSPRVERHKAHEVDDLGLNVVNLWTITML
ncbi:Growth-regulating factor 6 [Dendrobium catenatum]|uniref:Growth-regulating factor n=1 Tax=Dendrobium catenatum TaxID=906689 RepID=A0A2I0X6C2_9ASPA|nr:Growth-regulating factor 6 [Dendrobium catenatum]